MAAPRQTPLLSTTDPESHMTRTQALLSTTALFMALASTAQAQSIKAEPSSSLLNIGETFTVAIQAFDFADRIVGGGYNIAFDPTVLRLDGIDIPANWEFARSTGLLDAVAGTVSDVYFNTFAAPIKGDFLTSTLRFTAMASGTSSITLSDSPSFPFGNEDAFPVAVSYGATSVTVAAVPEPETLSLMLSGMALVGVVAARRRRQG